MLDGTLRIAVPMHERIAGTGRHAHTRHSHMTLTSHAPQRVFHVRLRACIGRLYSCHAPRQHSAAGVGSLWGGGVGECGKPAPLHA